MNYARLPEILSAGRIIVPDGRNVKLFFGDRLFHPPSNLFLTLYFPEEYYGEDSHR